MSKIITHAPNKAYDEGWDALFGKKNSAEQREVHAEGEKSAPDHVHELGSCSVCDTKLRNDHERLPGGAIRHPRGCLCHVKK